MYFYRFRAMSEPNGVRAIAHSNRRCAQVANRDKHALCMRQCALLAHFVYYDWRSWHRCVLYRFFSRASHITEHAPRMSETANNNQCCVSRIVRIIHFALCFSLGTSKETECGLPIVWTFAIASMLQRNCVRPIRRCVCVCALPMRPLPIQKW